MNVQEKTRELLEVGRQEVGLDDERLERNRSRVLARALGVSVVGAGIVASTSAAAGGGATVGGAAAGAGVTTKTLAALSLAKLTMAVVVVGGTMGGGYVLATRASREPVASPVVPSKPVGPGLRQHSVGQPALVPESARQAIGPGEVDAKPSQPPAPVPGGAVSKPHAAASRISEHADLLRDARSALAGGDAAKALSLLDQHPEVSRGPLGPEWSAARVLVLCRLGRVAEARQAAHRFLKAHPSSPLAAQVAASCAAAD